MSLVGEIRLGPYEILAPLGAGGMGEVYRATDTRLGRTVALKVIPESFLEDEERRRRFEKEARTLASLNHPNIATIYSFEETEGRHVLTMELLEGESLREVIQRRTPTTRQVLSWALQVAQGLSAAHAKGIVHRDIKPENLFLTTDGRLKILDFGLAKLVALTPAETEAATESGLSTPGMIVGTVAYMSPEQIGAESVDQRSDVFSLGVVLYELLAREHPFRRATVPATLTAIVNETPRDLSLRQPGVLPGVDRVVRRCLEKRREERYQSAQELATALETVLEGGSSAAALRDVEERSPYPGLSSFTEEDAGRFFGREEEVAALWRKIHERRLLAVIGPSGAGKTSFVRAGVIPARPEGWAAIVSTPGKAPLRSLGQALAPRLAHDPEALRKLVTFDDPESAFDLVSRWRRSNEEALVVVDQFEELFTLNPPETQARFAVLLGRLAQEADVHVVVSMRDDFLIRCHEHPALAAIFESLTPLGPMTRDGLRRALVEPAAKRGYRFEDDVLVGEMIAAVDGARGALPLLAFAVARLWEKRDREKKVLTRQANAEIGGVAGALAQHAEATVDRVGSGRESLVREIFRNLVTAQGTRAVMDREELLSAFPDRAGAEEVLRQLVDARLLTSFEMDGKKGEPADVRIEVVHESLLKAWPRLVRWQAQEEEGTVLRDQLRQAARLWEEKGRTGDLLWTGTAFQEYELWRARYKGALPAVEDEFGRAMRARAHQRRRRQSLAAASAIGVLAAVAIVVGISRQQAVGAARRAEASKLLAIGQERLASDPTEALAYTTASIDTADSREARLFALRTLFEAPPALEVVHGKVSSVWTPSFSPDGRLLASGGYDKASAAVYPEDGGPPRELPGHAGSPVWVGNRLVLDEDRRASVWSLPDLKLERTLEYGGLSAVQGIGERVYLRTDVGEEFPPAEWALRSWDPAGAELQELGRVRAGGVQGFGPDGASWLCALGPSLLPRPLPISTASAGTVLGEHLPEIVGLRQTAAGLVTLNRAREMRLWTLEGGKAPSSTDIPVPSGAVPPLVVGDRWISERVEQGVRFWKRDSWPGARPLALRRDRSWWNARFAVRPAGDWFVATTSGGSRLTFWPLATPRPVVIDGFRTMTKVLAFSPDGRWLATSWGSGSQIRLWPLAPGTAGPRTFAMPGQGTHNLAFDPAGRFLFSAGTNFWIVPLDGRPPRELAGFKVTPWVWAAAVSPSGGLVATAYMTGEGDRTLRVWDVETGSSRAWDVPWPAVRAKPPGPPTFADQGGIFSLAFEGESTLYSAGWGGVRRWDLTSGRHEVVIPASGGATWLDMAIRPELGIVLTQRRADVDCAPVVHHDLARKSSRELRSFGDCAGSYDLDPAGRVLAVGGADGVIRVGRLDGGEPHLLVGHKGGASAVVSPDLKWIASTGDDNTLRLWPMPDLDKPPLHTLPQAELVAKLKSLTNLRAVRDAKAATGWKIEVGLFPGWKDVPTWQP